MTGSASVAGLTSGVPEGSFLVKSISGLREDRSPPLVQTPQSDPAAHLLELPCLILPLQETTDLLRQPDSPEPRPDQLPDPGDRLSSKFLSADFQGKLLPENFPRVHLFFMGQDQA